MTEHNHNHISADAELESKLASVRQTKPRRLVMDVMKQAKAPMTAIEILSEVEKTGEQIWLSTIYRVLDLFVEKDIAVKSTLLGQDQAVYGLDRYQHTHYAICIGCHRIIPMDNCPIAAAGFSPELQEENFRIVGHKIEIYGYCGDCDSKR